MRPSIRAGYLDVGSGAAFGQLHLGAGGDSGVAVLMLAPFGWDEVSSYRSRRDWAEALARGGFPTLRVDLPGSGDSTGSPRDSDRLESWSAAVVESARWLREATAARRVAAVGLGLGGMLAYIAIARDAAIDDLVLWATPARGRRLVRELRAFASLQGTDFPELAQGLEPNQGPVGKEPAAQDGSLLAGGFVMTAETISAIERLDLVELSLPAAAGRRVLLLGRDGAPVDERLRDHLEAAEAAVEVRPGPGYGRMTAKPHDSQPPLAVFATVRQWLASAPSGETAGAGERVVARPSSPAQLAGALELAAGDAGVRESLISIDQPGGQLFGVLAEPATGPVEPLCAVLLNAGGIRHTGPNRMWVEAARRWAGRGVVTLRLDLSGLGDAEGDSRTSELDGLYDSGRVPEVRAALDELASRRPGSSFVLSGLCSGAYWSLHTALADDRVTAALMLNPRAFFWDETIEKMRELRMGLLDPSLWRKVLRGEIRLGRVAALLRWAPSVPGTAWRRGRARRRAGRAGGDQVDEAFDRLGDRGQRVLLAFSGREPLHHELAREGRLERLASRPNVVLEALPGETHTLRSLQAQRAAHDLLDRELEAELRRLRG